MSAAASVMIEGRVGQNLRREHILDAAEACFVRNGFHRTTMQDLAREAAMSPGNIYRYFESKEAVVRGLAERDRERGLVLIAELECATDRRGALMRILRRYFEMLSRETAVLRVDLWSEATRNPDIASLVAQGEAEARSWLIETFTSLAEVSDCDADALYDRVNPLMKGMLVDRALLPGHDPARAIAHLLAQIDAALCGASAIDTASDRSR